MKPPFKKTGKLFHFSQRDFKAAVVISALLFILLTLLVFNGLTTAMDKKATLTAQTWETAQRNKVMLFITFLGNYQFLVPANLLLIIFFLLRKKKKIALLVFIIAITGLGLKFLLKAAFARPRPDNPIVEGIQNFSYPSGHALMSVAFYGLIILLANEITTNQFRKKILYIACTLLILLIGFSRVYLRVHYPTDVMAGYLLGIVWIAGFALIAHQPYFGLYAKR
jgi:membrane-associated phospholipid phosphatase